MGLFGFGKKHKEDQVSEDRVGSSAEDPGEVRVQEVDQDQPASEDAKQEKGIVEDTVRDHDKNLDGADSDQGERGIDHGPWDSQDDDVVDYDDYLDIGALMLPFLKGSQFRLKANGKTGEILGATITYGSSSLELEAFAAPKTLGLWDEVRAELLKANPKCRQVQGVFGLELELPVKVKGKEFMTRVVGIDGPRWMLRGIFSGPAARKGKEKDLLDKYLEDLVVVRGDDPLAPRDLIPMHAPITPDQRREEGQVEEKESGKGETEIPDKPKGPFDSDQQTEVKTTLSRGPMFSEVR